MANAMTEYKGYSDADKAALRELCDYAKTKKGLSECKTSDMIAAVTPGFDTPEHLKGV